MTDTFAYRAGDPETSRSAAAGMSASVVEGLRQLVLSALRDASPGGLTVPEIAAATAVPVISISPRIRPMVREGLVVDSGEKRTLPGHRACIVWNLSGARP